MTCKASTLNLHFGEICTQNKNAGDKGLACLVNRDEYFAFHHCIIFNQNLHHDDLMSCGHILLRSWWNVLLSNYLQSWFRELGTDSCPQHWNYSLKVRPGPYPPAAKEVQKKWCNTCCMDFVILKHGLLLHIMMKWKFWLVEEYVESLMDISHLESSSPSLRK